MVNLIQMSLKKYKTGVLLLLTTLLVCSCQRSSLIEEKSVNCYFQYEYINHAWGFNHSGFIITPAGEMYTFDKTTPWIFSENGVLSSDSLQNNLKASVKRDTLISSTDIIYYQHLASYTMDGKISEMVMHGADMGANICKIIVPDSSNPLKSYREIILTHIGDTEFHNLAPEAGVIAAWLKKITIK
jgi:hypothetical protein